MIEFDDDLMDECYDIINDLLMAGNFKAVDLMLRIVSVTSLDIDGMITLLTLSNLAYKDLPYRETFLKEVEEELIKRGEGNVKSLLSGLQGIEPSVDSFSLSQFGIYDPRGYNILE